MKHHDTILLSWVLENKWLEHAEKLLEIHGTLPVPVFIAELAYLCDVSVLTSRRYLQKHSALSATLMVKDGLVSLKSHEEF